MGLSVALDSRDGPTQFGSVFPIPSVSKRAQKLMRMGLQDRGPGAHDFPPFTPGVAGGTQGAQTPLGGRPILLLAPGQLAGRLNRPIPIQNKVMVPLPVEHPA